MMTCKQNLSKQRILFGIVALLFSTITVGQVTESYTMQTGNFNSMHTIHTSANYGAGAGNNTATEINTYAYGGQAGYTGDPGIALFRSFSTDGSSTFGSTRSLQVGDQFSITAYVGNNTSFFNGSSAGISFNNGTSNSAFSDYNSSQRLKLQIFKGGSWFVAGAAAAAGHAYPGADVTVTFKVTSSNTVNVEISRFNTSPQTGATTSELQLTGSGSIESFSIWNQTSGGGNDVYWKSCSVESTGSVELGGNSQSNSLTTISGVISDGLAANSTSTTSANALVKNGSGSITLTGANTYTGATTVNSGTLVVSGSGTLGSSSAVTVASGATLRISNSINIASLNNSGTVEIDPGATLTISGDLITNSVSTITINADNTGYGQVKVGGTITNSGTISQSQYIGSTGHHGISSPMTFGFTTTSGTSSTLYGYNATTGAWDMSPTTSTVGAGFFAPVQASNGFQSAAGGFSVTGTPNTSHTHSLGYAANTATGGSGSGWNLIGNPYTCGLDWTSVTKTNVNNAFYVWDASNGIYQYYSGSALTGTYLAASSILSGVIPPMQAFWVQSTASGGSIVSTMASDGTVASSPTFYKTAPDNLILYAEDLNDPSLSDAMWIIHSAGYTKDFEGDQDAWKHSNYGGQANIYSYHDGEKLAINAMDLSSTTSIPVGVGAPEDGRKYRIVLEQLVNNQAYQVVLEDKLMNSFTDISNQGYSFTSGLWQNEDPRFVLHISQSTVGIGEESLQSLKLYQQGDRLIIQGNAQAHGRYSLITLDGRQVAEGVLQAGMANIQAPIPGVYIVQLSGAVPVAQRVLVH